MDINFKDYPFIRELIGEIDGTEESLDEFIKKFKRLTNIEKINLAEDNVFEIEDLDFAEISDLLEYFTVQEIIDTKYYKELIRLASLVDTREEFCEKATSITNIPVKQYGTVVRLNNIDFLRKKDLIDYLNAFEVFNSLAELAYDYEVAEDGRGISLDGVAFVHDTKQAMIDNPQEDFPMEGYLYDGEVKWSRVDKEAFKGFKTKKGILYILRLLSDANIKTVYLNKPKEFGVVEKPYPVAILPKNKYAYIFKN